MPKDVAIAARIDSDLDLSLRKLATATKRSRSWHVAEALRGYVAAEQEFLAAVADGQRALADGKIIDHSEIKKRFQRRLSRRK